jgi:hypothetical protein
MPMWERCIELITSFKFCFRKQNCGSSRQIFDWFIKLTHYGHHDEFKILKIYLVICSCKIQNKYFFFELWNVFCWRQIFNFLTRYVGNAALSSIKQRMWAICSCKINIKQLKKQYWYCMFVLWMISSKRYNNTVKINNTQQKNFIVQFMIHSKFGRSINVEFKTAVLIYILLNPSLS